MSKAIVARPVNAITLNSELEFLLDDDGKVRMFDNKEQAWLFLAAAGVEPEELRCMTIAKKMKGDVAMQILIVEPERKPELKEIDGSLETMQEIVGGLIQPVYLDDSVVLVCNDEGRLMNLPANRGLRDKDGQIYDIVCGTFFLCGAPPDSDHFTSLTPEQVKQYEEQFHTPEMFWGMDGRIVCLPLDVD